MDETRVLTWLRFIFKQYEKQAKRVNQDKVMQEIVKMGKTGE